MLCATAGLDVSATSGVLGEATELGLTEAASEGVGVDRAIDCDSGVATLALDRVTTPVGASRMPVSVSLSVTAGVGDALGAVGTTTVALVVGWRITVGELPVATGSELVGGSLRSGRVVGSIEMVSLGASDLTGLRILERKSTRPPSLSVEEGLGVFSGGGGKDSIAEVTVLLPNWRLMCRGK